MTDEIPLLDCPFCGAKQASDAGPQIQDRDRVDRMTRNKLGKPHRRIRITHYVMCNYCGAEGPHSMFDFANSDAPELTPEMIMHSAQAAAMEWNRRQPISDRAFEVVNRLITDTMAALEQSKKSE